VLPLARSLSFAVLLAACTSVRALEPGEPVRFAPGEALAIGRLRVFEGERELTPWKADLLEELTLPGEPEIRLALFRMESEQRALYPAIGADGWFAWVLRAGTWLVYQSSRAEPIWHDVLCAFQVLAVSEAQYVGELELHVHVERDPDLQATAYSVEGVTVRSDPEAARAHLARSHPRDSLELVERPLKSSPELRDVFDDWKRSRAERVLANLGITLLCE